MAFVFICERWIVLSQKNKNEAEEEEKEEKEEKEITVTRNASFFVILRSLSRCFLLLLNLTSDLINLIF